MKITLNSTKRLVFQSPISSATQTQGQAVSASSQNSIQALNNLATNISSIEAEQNSAAPRYNPFVWMIGFAAMALLAVGGVGLHHSSRTKPIEAGKNKSEEVKPPISTPSSPVLKLSTPPENPKPKSPVPPPSNPPPEEETPEIPDPVVKLEEELPEPPPPDPGRPPNIDVIEEFIIGREGDPRFPVNQGFVSRRHLKVQKRDGKLFITDLQSRNGTFVCKKGSQSFVKLREDQLVELVAGDRITLSPREEVIFEVNGDLEFRAVAPKEVKPLITDLFPKGILDGRFQQGNIGNCYYHASMDAARRTPEGLKAIEAMLEEFRPNVYKIQFANQSITIRRAELDLGKQAKGDLGWQVLERAYARYRRIIENVDPGKSILIIEGRDSVTGEPRTVFQDVFGWRQTRIEDKKQYFNKLQEMSQNPKLIAMASSGRDAWDHSGFKILGNHAYSIHSVDAKNQTVTLVNPHNSDSRIKLTYKQFKNSFRALTVAEIPN